MEKEKIYVNDQENMVLNLIQEGKTEYEAVAAVEKLKEDNENGYNTLVAIVGDTYITRESNIEVLKETYGVDFVPVRID